jgi:hypothetical protein
MPQQYHACAADIRGAHTGFLFLLLLLLLIGHLRLGQHAVSSYVQEWTRAQPWPHPALASGSPGMGLGSGVCSFSNSGKMSGRRLGCGVIHSCRRNKADSEAGQQ